MTEKITKPQDKDFQALSVGAVVDPTPQILRPIRPAGHHLVLPLDLTNNAKLVVDGLFKCFMKNGFIKEGLVVDILWGFDVSEYDLNRVAYGLIDLKRAGYIAFIAPDNTETDEHCTQLSKCWVKYKPKFLALIEG